MERLSALIVDDEHLARRNLELALAAHPQWVSAGACAGAAEALRVLAARPVDLILLDIAMPGRSGLSLARELAERADVPLIAFVTAYDDHAIEAFDLFAIDYLLKPFDDARFAALLDRAEALIRQRQLALQAEALRRYLGERRAVDGGAPPPAVDSLVIRSTGRLDRVAVAGIERVQAAGNYVELHVGGRVLLHRATMAAVEARLPPDHFVRVHRTAIVRRDLLSSLTRTGERTWTLHLTTGAEVPVSDRFIQAVRDAMAPGPTPPTGRDRRSG